MWLWQVPLAKDYYSYAEIITILDAALHLTRRPLESLYARHLCLLRKFSRRERRNRHTSISRTFNHSWPPRFAIFAKKKLLAFYHPIQPHSFGDCKKHPISIYQWFSLESAVVSSPTNKNPFKISSKFDREYRRNATFTYPPTPTGTNFHFSLSFWKRQHHIQNHLIIPVYSRQCPLEPCPSKEFSRTAFGCGVSSRPES